MKYIFIITCLLFSLLGCSNTSHNNETKQKEDYSALLSESKSHYSLYTVGDDVTFEELEKDKITSVRQIITDKYLSLAKRSHKSLNLTKKPTYILFNNKEIVYRTNNRKDLISYLKNQNKAPIT